MTENRKSVGIEISGQQRTVSIRAPAQIGGHTVNVEALPVRSARHAETAERLATARQIAITGEAAGEGIFDGSEDIAIYTVIDRLTNSELEAILT